MDLTLPAGASGPLLVLSSRPYPVTFTDSAEIGHTMSSGRLYLSAVYAPSELADLSHSIAGGELRNQLQLYYGIPELANLTHAMSGGDLRQLLKSYYVPAELADLTHTMSGGSLRQLLIIYSLWPAELADLTHTMSGGSLT